MSSRLKYVGFDTTSLLLWEGMEKAELSLNTPVFFLLLLIASVVIGQIPAGTGGQESRIYLSEKILSLYRRKFCIVLYFQMVWINHSSQYAFIQKSSQQRALERRGCRCLAGWMKSSSRVPSASSAQPLRGKVPSRARTALAVLQHHSWVRTLCADEATDKVSICPRHGKTLLCNCSANTILWCSFICSSKSDFYFLSFISLFPMAFPNSPSPLAAVVSSTGESPPGRLSEGAVHEVPWVHFVQQLLCLRKRGDFTQSDTRDPWEGEWCISPVPSEKRLCKGCAEQWCWGEPRSLIPWLAGGVAWLTPVLAVLSSVGEAGPVPPETGGAHGKEDGQGLLWCTDWKENVCGQKPRKDFLPEAPEELWVCCNAGGHEKWRRVVAVRVYEGWGRIYAQCLVSCFLLLQKLPCSSLWS